MKPTILGFMMLIALSTAYTEPIPSYDFSTGQLYIPKVKVLSSTGDTIGFFEAYLETIHQNPIIDFTVKSATAVEDEISNNEQIASRFIIEVLSEGQKEVVDEIFAPDAVVHSMDSFTPNLEITGPTAVKQIVDLYRSSFNDLQVTIDDSLVDGDKVIIRWTARGTHTGDLPNLPASQIFITMSGIDISLFKAGKIIDLWHTADTLGMMKQLGAIPESSPIN